jgi:biuret amidohydrolase
VPFGLDTVRPAVVTIDLHRGHLDPTVATMPVTPGTEQAIIAANQDFLAAARRAGVPVVHCVTRYLDPLESAVNPFWHAGADRPGNTRGNQERHNLTGAPGTQLVPELLDQGTDVVLDTKRRYNCFTATDLDFVLRSRGVNTLVLTGVNTNSCVLATATAACSLDYAVVVAEDCVATMDGDELHRAALLCIATAFGWVRTGADVVREVFGVRDLAPARAATGGTA